MKFNIMSMKLTQNTITIWELGKHYKLGCSSWFRPSHSHTHTHTHTYIYPKSTAY